MSDDPFKNNEENSLFGDKILRSAGRSLEALELLEPLINMVPIPAAPYQLD